MYLRGVDIGASNSIKIVLCLCDATGNKRGHRGIMAGGSREAESENKRWRLSRQW